MTRAQSIQMHMLSGDSAMRFPCGGVNPFATTIRSSGPTREKQFFPLNNVILLGKQLEIQHWL